MLITGLGLAIVGSLGGLDLALSHAASSGGRGVGRLALVLLAGLGVTASAGLALLVRLLTRSDELARVNRLLTERNRELEAASTAKNRFVANLAHELRNPLSAVIGYSELMASGRFGPLADRQHEHLEVIRDSGQHLLALIDELLDMARVEAGHLHLETAPTDPAAVTRRCVAALHPQAARREVALELDAPDSGRVMLDPTRLRQVMLNFLANAIKHSPRAGTVVIRLRYAHGGVRVEVSDAGPGLSAEDQRRVFEEFFQASGGERSGTGLGLAVTRLLVEAQGGHVSVHSRPGEGSTFSAWLPAADAENAIEPADRSRTWSLVATASGPSAQRSGSAVGVL
jgi:signal transduction histidine kinase